MALYSRLSRDVLVFFARRVFESEVAMDLTAETFAEAFSDRHRFRGHTETEAAAWLFSIARHQFSHYVRRGKAELRALERLGLEVPDLTQGDLDRVEELADLASLREEVSRGMDSVSAEQRDALRLRVVDELPYREVAMRLAISEETARARVSRGLRALLCLLEPTPRTEESHP